jgi:hypothetical protein
VRRRDCYIYTTRHCAKEAPLPENQDPG